MEAKNNEISSLKKDKEALMTVNGNLLQKVKVQIDSQNEPKTNNNEPQEDFDFRTCFDEKRKF